MTSRGYGMEERGNTDDEYEIKIAEEFQHLVDKSHNLFAGLRDLPQAGQKHWQPYFQRTFDVYTKLWKFQQQNRHVLENKRYYGLKRCEIGEIASKIGQLYYHYYLRTSETNYLQESYIFYDAIRSRGYFKNILEAKNPNLVVRKLRYYARYIVVCLLLNRKDMANQLLMELRQLVEQYSKVFRPTDAREWQLVLQEISTFVRADSPFSVLDRPAGTPNLTFRLRPDDGTLSPVAEGNLLLKDVILVGNQARQVKFSELTLDMYRIVQCLEYEFGSQNQSQNQEDPNVKTNPHKYLLFKPELSSFLVYLASAFRDLPSDGVLMVYVVADGEQQYQHQHQLKIEYDVSVDQPQSLKSGAGVSDQGQGQTKPKPISVSTSSEDVSLSTSTEAEKEKENLSESAKIKALLTEGMEGGYGNGYVSGIGGLVMNPGSDIDSEKDKDEGGEGEGDGKYQHHVHVLLPSDLLPYTRKPLFLVIDSNNSSAFNGFPALHSGVDTAKANSRFGEPVVVLMSPEIVPPALRDPENSGGLLTMFLSSPLVGFFAVVGVSRISHTDFTKGEMVLNDYFISLQKLIQQREFSLHPYLTAMLGDDFLRALIFRFIFCNSVLVRHRSCFNNPRHVPHSTPVIPSSLIMHPSSLKAIKSLIDIADLTGKHSFVLEEIE